MNGIIPPVPEPETLDLPPTTDAPVDLPCDVPMTPDVAVRERLWTVIYNDDGSMHIRDAPRPGTLQ